MWYEIQLAVSAGLSGLRTCILLLYPSEHPEKDALQEDTVYRFLCVSVYRSFLYADAGRDAIAAASGRISLFDQLGTVRDWKHLYGDYRMEIIYNVLLFVPFGFLHQQLFRSRYRTTLLLGFLFSLCIELIQPLLSYTRIADVTDLFDNTVGTLIGIIAWHLIHYFIENLKLRNQ